MTAPAPSVRAVVFDLDGLMFNTEEIHQQVSTEVLARRGKSFDDELLDAIMGRQPRVSLQTMIDYHRLDATVDQLERESEEIFAGLLEGQLAFMPGAAELLAAIETRRVPKAIATSSGRRFVDSVLARFDLSPRFQFMLTAEDVKYGKPHPEIYLTAAGRLGVAPAEMLVLEDSQNGCRAAVTAGACAVAVPAGRSLQHDFSGARLIADTLADRRIYELLGIA